MSSLTLQEQDNIALIAINVAGESQNIINTEFIESAEKLLSELEQNTTLKGVVFYSSKSGSFIAGADIHMLAACRDASEVVALARRGQRLCHRIASLKIPVIAAIDGVCLGGGLEFALACHGRVCSDSDKTQLGLPEVQLGLLPGSGGTQRLPRLIGPQAALEMMLTGRKLRPLQALLKGLVDEVVPASILLQVAQRRIEALQQDRRRKRRKTLSQHLLEDTPLGRTLLFNQARKRTRAKTKDHYPAPEQIIDCVEYGLQRGFNTGLEFEAEKFGMLSQTPQARQLMHLYFAVTALKKDKGVDETVKPKSVQRIGVLGAGLMGAGIAIVSSTQAKLDVRLKDKDHSGLQRGLSHIHDQIQQRRKRGRITAFEADQQQRRITATTDYTGFANIDLVIEAVFEDLALKQKMLDDIETHCRPDTIFATNTSSIPLADIAATAERPEQVVGMHYFSPVDKMPLLEVISHNKTAPEVIATAVACGQQQGKTVISVQDGAGFYVNRILAPYINEAGYMLLEGIDIETIDQALIKFGFPVGPFTLLDEVGLDVAGKVSPFLQKAFGERMQPPALIEKMIDAERLGKKSGRGFYLYAKKRKKEKKVDDGVYELLNITPEKSHLNENQIAERCVLPMLNEAVRCLDEEIIRSARDGDIGAVFGIGFPPFLGGPFRYLDSLSHYKVVQKLQTLEQQYGMRFAPCEVLLKRDEQFYS